MSLKKLSSNGMGYSTMYTKNEVKLFCVQNHAIKMCTKSKIIVFKGFYKKTFLQNFENNKVIYRNVGLFFK